MYSILTNKTNIIVYEITYFMISSIPEENITNKLIAQSKYIKFRLDFKDRFTETSYYLIVEECLSHFIL